MELIYKISQSCIPYTLCTNERQWNKLKRAYNIQTDVEWCAGSSGATHGLRTGGDDWCVICVDLSKKPSLASALDTLVHEIIHLKQAHFQFIGVETPEDEQEAYTVQSMFRDLYPKLVRDWNRQNRKKK